MTIIIIIINDNLIEINYEIDFDRFSPRDGFRRSFFVTDRLLLVYHKTQSMGAI